MCIALLTCDGNGIGAKSELIINPYLYARARGERASERDRDSCAHACEQRLSQFGTQKVHQKWCKRVVSERAIPYPVNCRDEYDWCSCCRAKVPKNLLILESQFPNCRPTGSYLTWQLESGD